ncbi:hypothetical protein [Microlunatus parietis]|uniref:Uncharacterized protein n=1 Tax=Microlunatus parietis TaxID=682979 RepID=A0A7Y9IBK1_9ACTN|nr:hypothetical protein [Microlunatus parietis]NYE73628.1 hypothetical protein [Microlunatus parietis]
MTHYPSYVPAELVGAAEQAAAQEVQQERRWQVLVEYSNHGGAMPPTIIELYGDGATDLAGAVAEAERAAFEFDPPDPRLPQDRHVFRTGEGEFVVIIEGAVSQFYLKVTVGELCDAPGAPTLPG